MDNLAMKSRDVVAPLRLGSAVPAQPLSGNNTVNAKAVHGLGRAGYERNEEHTRKN
jgi:hypothetical protein